MALIMNITEFDYFLKHISPYDYKVETCISKLQAGQYGRWNNLAVMVSYSLPKGTIHLENVTLEQLKATTALFREAQSAVQFIHI